MTVPLYDALSGVLRSAHAFVSRKPNGDQDPGTRADVRAHESHCPARREGFRADAKHSSPLVSHHASAAARSLQVSALTADPRRGGNGATLALSAPDFRSQSGMRGAYVTRISIRRHPRGHAAAGRRPCATSAQDIDALPVPIAELSAGYVLMQDTSAEHKYPVGWLVLLRRTEREPVVRSRWRGQRKLPI